MTTLNPTTELCIGKTTSGNVSISIYEDGKHMSVIIDGVHARRVREVLSRAIGDEQSDQKSNEQARSQFQETKNEWLRKHWKPVALDSMKEGDAVFVVADPQAFIKCQKRLDAVILNRWNVSETDWRTWQVRDQREQMIAEARTRDDAIDSAMRCTARPDASTEEKVK